MGKRKNRKNKAKKKEGNKESIQEYFERRTGHLMTEYIAEHLARALNKYESKIFVKSLRITLDRHEVRNFETPADLIRYMYAVCRNVANQSTWETVK